MYGGPSSVGGLNGHNALPRKNPAIASQMSLAPGAKTDSVSLFDRNLILYPLVDCGYGLRGAFH